MNSGGTLRTFSFALIATPDGRWRHSMSKIWYGSRMDAWRCGMELVRQKLDILQGRRWGGTGEGGLALTGQ